MSHYQLELTRRLSMAHGARAARATRARAGGSRRGERAFFGLAFVSAVPVVSLIVHTKDYYKDIVHPKVHPGKPMPYHNVHWYAAAADAQSLLAGRRKR